MYNLVTVHLTCVRMIGQPFCPPLTHWCSVPIYGLEIQSKHDNSFMLYERFHMKWVIDKQGMTTKETPISLKEVSVQVF